MKQRTVTGVAVAGGKVEMVTRDEHDDHAAIRLTPREAGALAVTLGEAATDAGDNKALLLERRINHWTPVTVKPTRSGHARFDWNIGPYHHRVVIDSQRIRQIADSLHDIADRITDQEKDTP